MKRLFFDIETSPCVGWFWRPGYSINLNYDNIIEHAKIICICYKWQDEDKIHCLSWDSKKDDGAMMKKFIKIMNKADEIVAHNGDKFDIRWVRTRALVHGITTVPRWQTFDTLKSIRANIALPSNRLGDIGRYFGLGEKIKTDADLWKNIVFGDGSRMEEMLEYCKQDVKLLQDVFETVVGVVPIKSHEGVLMGEDKWSCPNCGGTHIKMKSKRTTPTGIIKYQMHCKSDSCSRYYLINSHSYIKYLKEKHLKKF